MIYGKDIDRIFNSNEIINFPEMLLRWPSNPYRVFLAQLIKRNLHFYFIESIYEEEDNIYIRLSDITEGFIISTSFYMENIWKIVCLKKEVESLERTNIFINKKLIFEDGYAIHAEDYVCTYKNIHHISARIVYLICSFNTSFDGITSLNPFKIRKFLNKQEETSECPRGPVLSWSIPSEILWNLHKIFANFKHKDSDVTTEIIHLKKILFKYINLDEIDQLKEIYSLYPKLTSAQIGKIFPAKENRQIKYSGIQSRGKKLKSNLFMRYPELKEYIGVLQKKKKQN